MSFLLPPAPPTPSRDADVPERAAAVAERIERVLRERTPPPDIGPVLAEIRAAAEALAQHPRVSGDAQAVHLLRMMALAEDMELFDALAEALRAHLAAAPAVRAPQPTPAPPEPARAARVLLRL